MRSGEVVEQPGGRREGEGGEKGGGRGGREGGREEGGREGGREGEGVMIVRVRGCVGMS